MMSATGQLCVCLLVCHKKLHHWGKAARLLDRRERRAAASLQTAEVPYTAAASAFSLPNFSLAFSCLPAAALAASLSLSLSHCNLLSARQSI